jgi:hypothetical protein
MANESLDELVLAFHAWRKSKRTLTERVPEALLERARRVAVVHGVRRVAHRIGVSRARLEQAVGGSGRLLTTNVPSPTPTFSRIHIPPLPPPPAVQPLAEAETAAGFRLRVFALTPETLGLLSSLCRLGGAL